MREVNAGNSMSRNLPGEMSDELGAGAGDWSWTDARIQNSPLYDPTGGIDHDAKQAGDPAQRRGIQA
jgi:hypothetical protein